jgi:circadian clock protein KaiC
MRFLRELHVRMFRGSNFLTGLHLMTITNAGVTVYPRTEVVHADASNQPPQPLAISQPSMRMQTGIIHLDEMLQGGIHTGSTTLLLGASGTGKTLLGSHFLVNGAQQKQKGLYFGFYETASQLAYKLARFDLNIERFITDGLLEIKWQSPLQDHLDLLAEEILHAVYERGVQRLFLDGLGGFQRSIDSSERLDLFLVALFTALRASGVTVICSVELPDLFSPTVTLPANISGITALVENILLLRYVELKSQLYRLISIMKVRESDYDSTIREFRITDQGIEVASTFASAEAILTGIAHDASTPISTNIRSAFDTLEPLSLERNNDDNNPRS